MGLRSSASGADFEEFASVSLPRLRHAGWLLTGHDQDAEDLAQVALAKTYAAWARGRHQAGRRDPVMPAGLGPAP